MGFARGSLYLSAELEKMIVDKHQFVQTPWAVTLSDSGS